jgi:hypothetical protein
MNESPERRPPHHPRRRWQFGLARFLFTTTLVGVFIGWGLPLLIRWLAEQHRAFNPPPVPTNIPSEFGFEAGVYYESAETPLD